VLLLHRPQEQHLLGRTARQSSEIKEDVELALELQQFNIERIWIRGEANILADAPSRAPWEETLAQFPIPYMPVRDLIVKLYQAPDEVDDLVSRRRQVLTGDKTWETLPVEDARKGPFLDQARHGELPTPDFGSGRCTPEFGEPASWTTEILAFLGEGRILEASGAEWPRFPMCVLSGPPKEDVRFGEELQRPYPEEPYPFPACGIERRKDERGFNYLIRWPRRLKFVGDQREKETMWFNANKETYEGEAEEACWDYF